MVLNSDGELEEEAETHAERHARTIALAQVLALVVEITDFVRQKCFLNLDLYFIWNLICLYLLNVQQVQKPKKDSGRQRQNRRRQKVWDHILHSCISI